VDTPARLDRANPRINTFHHPEKLLLVEHEEEDQEAS
jgi:hypothetical protein